MISYEEITKMNIATVNKKLNEKRKELVNISFQQVSNKLKDVKSVGKIKKEIARILTFLNTKNEGDDNE